MCASPIPMMMPPLPKSELLEIADAQARVTVAPLLGAGLARYDVKRGSGWLSVLRPWSSRKAEGPFALASNVLAPWSNRISGGGFEFDGVFHALEPNFPGEPYPLHGSAFQQVWEVVEHQPNSVMLRLRCAAPPPFHYEAQLRYRLQDGQLFASLVLRNLAPIRLPYGIGFHPWFARHGGLLLHAPAQYFWSEAPDHLPVARIACKQSDEYDFATPAPFPDSWVNSAFEGWNGQAVLHYLSMNYQVEISASDSLPAFMLYSPSTVSNFVCFEPVSHVPDAHHLSPDETLAPLHVLEPEQTLEGWMRLRVQQ
jgi:aldose 1-epimerase